MAAISGYGATVAMGKGQPMRMASDVKILLYISDGPGQQKVFRGRSVILNQHTNTKPAVDPLSNWGVVETPHYFIGQLTTAEVELDEISLSAPSLASQMALAVLAGDRAAALALADAVLNERLLEGVR